MITAKELRLGSFISPANGEKDSYSIVVGLQANGNVNFISSISEYTGSTKKPNPIPLTEEWLLKFGFVDLPFSDPDNVDYGLGMFYIQFHKEVDDFICLNTSPDFIQVKYVHELQNLYFALTGEELTIKD